MIQSNKIRTAIVLPPGYKDLSFLLGEVAKLAELEVVETYNSGKAAAGLAPNKNLGLICITNAITDVKPSQLVQQFRSNPSQKNIPILILPIPGRGDPMDTNRAVAMGAIVTSPMPEEPRMSFAPKLARGLKASIRRASARTQTQPKPASAKSPAPSINRPGAPPPIRRAERNRIPSVIAIGISTGGPQALAEVFSKLKPNLPPILMVQHIPHHFAVSLAARLDSGSQVKVVIGKPGMKLERGTAYLAPGSDHMLLSKVASGLQLKIDGGEKVSGHKPSADALFLSIAKASVSTAAILMTGMGQDGARGLLQLKQQGAITAAQDRATSIVYGMPQAAEKNGATETFIPLSKVANWINQIGSGAAVTV